MKNFIVGAVIIGVAIIIGCILIKPDIYNISNLGQSGERIHTERQVFLGGLIEGGPAKTFTSATSVTWTAKDISDYGLLTWIPTEGGGSTTLPTAASIIAECLLNQDGEYKDIVYYNQGDPASTTYFATSTGTHVYIPAGGNFVIDGGNVATFRFVRTSSTTVGIIITEGTIQ